MYQGLDKPLSDILETLDSVYGSVENKQQLLSEFYGARQRGDEDITAWSRRLEEIIGKGLEKGIVRQNEVNSMLHSMLWTGLRQELQDISETNRKRSSARSTENIQIKYSYQYMQINKQYSRKQ